MINTISDFLLQLKNKEIEVLKKYDIIKHPGLIGSMYEGLTKDLLDKAVFKGLNLKVSSGKIKNMLTQELSAEIDCMIVIGDGENIPYTDKYIYDSKKVIAVIQVKKNLFSKDIKDSFENLRSVVKTTEFKDGEKYHMSLLRNAYTNICKEELPRRNELNSIPMDRQMIYHTLLLEAFYPVRIVWGYNGFSSEHSLREAFYKFLEENLSDDSVKKTGFGPLNFPSLIICDKYTLLKSNGMPFAYPIVDDKWWLLYASSFENPLYFLLELIWTRLEHMFEINSEIYGEDLKVDQMHGYLATKYTEINKLKGWTYMYIEADKKKLEEPLIHAEWAPVYLNKTQFVAINKLCINPINYKTDKGFISFIKSEGYNMDVFIAELKTTGLVQIKNGTIDLITEQCATGITNEGKFYAGENVSGRVTRWLTNFAKRKNGL